MAMPYRRQIYGRRLAQVQREWSEVAAAIARFEPLHVVVPPGTRRATLGLGEDVGMVELAYDDMWIRDNGPIVVTGTDGSRVGLDWRFDGWGGAFDRFGQTWARDDRLPEPLLSSLGMPRETVDMVLEGGAVQSDGNGTILTTRENLLEAGRNPELSDAEVEAALLDRFGARQVIWLPFGLLGDLTAGHVDGVAMFVGRGRVVAQTDPSNDQEQERLAENLRVLRAASDVDGRPLDVLEFPLLPRGSFGGNAPTSFTYVNVAFADGALVVPTTGDERLDREALGLWGEIVPDREIVGVVAATLNWAGGAVHCITQQVPTGQ